MSPNSRKLLAVIGAILAVITVTITVSVGGDKPASVTITVKNADGEPVKVEAPKEAVAEAAGGEQQLGDESAASRRDLKSSDLANPAAPRIDGPVPLAAPQQAGCLTRQIPANWSYRAGTKPSLVVLHYTVSANRPGWDDVNSIVAYFSRSATSASSNYVIDNEGHCVYMVPESLKAWAQAGFNSATACSIEVINTGSEATYIGPRGGAGERALSRVVHDCAARWGIPLRRGATSGCSVVRSGVVDHVSLGSCGGGHSDIGKFRPGAIDRSVSGAKALNGKPKPAPKPSTVGLLSHARGDLTDFAKSHGGLAKVGNVKQAVELVDRAIDYRKKHGG